MIQSNYIGTNRPGTGAIGNLGHGVRISGSSHTVSARPTGGGANTIAFNSGDGIFVEANFSALFVNDVPPL